MKFGFQPILRAVPMVPMVSRMMVPSTTVSQSAAFIFDTCAEKSVAPRLKEVFSAKLMLMSLRPSSAPFSTSVPKSSSW
jgi:hypothetical protein